MGGEGKSLPLNRHFFWDKYSIKSFFKLCLCCIPILSFWLLFCRVEVKAGFSGTRTGAPLNLAMPTEDSFDWAATFNENPRIINSSWNVLTTNLTDVAVATASLQTQLNTMPTTYVNVGGDTMTGQLTIGGASTLTVQGSAFSVGGSTFSISGGSTTVSRLQTGTPLETEYGGTQADLSNSAQGAMPYFSATGVMSGLAPGTAGQVLQSGGAGANPSWTSSSLSERQGYVKDNFIAQVNGTATVFSLTSTPTAAGAVSVVLDGLLQSSTSDYTYATAGQIVTMNTAPSANSYSFYVAYSTGVTYIQADGTNCAAGEAARGVDAAGNAQGCFVTDTGFAASSTVYSGQNRFANDTTFSDSVYITAASTIGPQGYERSVIKSSGTFNNMWMVVASTYTVASSTLTFQNLTSNRRYRMSWSYTKNTAGYLYLRFNGDAASNYRWAVYGNNSNGNAPSHGSDNTAEECILNGGGTSSIGDTKHSEGEVNFAFEPVSTSTITLHGRHTFVDGNPFIHNNMFGCTYIRGSTPTQISMNTSAGTITGYTYLEELIVPNP